MDLGFYQNYAEIIFSMPENAQCRNLVRVDFILLKAVATQGRIASQRLHHMHMLLL